MSKAIEELKNLEVLLKQEQNEDREEYNRKVLSVTVKDRVAQGICWSPVYIRRQYYGTAERLILEVENGGNKEIEHAFQSGSVVSFFGQSSFHSEGSNQAHGVINYIKKDILVITMNDDELPDWMTENRIGVQLMFDEGSYKEMFNALKRVRKAENSRLAELREILLGYQKPEFHQIKPLEIPGINSSQNSALNKIIQAKDIALIHGPPGTGKTTTLVEAIYQTLKKETQVLVCAQSNAAVDLLTEKLSDRGLATMRLGHPARVTEKLSHLTLDARIAEHESYREIKKLRKQAQEYRRMAQKYKRNFGRSEREQRKLLFQEAHNILNQADMLEHYITNDLMAKSQVITCTLVGSEHYLLKGMTFSTLFIDEAAQALEPACWIPIIKAERVIMAGDHCQLPPTIKSFQAGRAGLNETLFEKIAKRLSVDTMLAVQYRMNEEIMNFSSQEFYKGNLEASTVNKAWKVHPEDRPVEFIDTAGCGFMEHVEKESRSTANRDEGNLLFLVLEEMETHYGIKVLKSSSIGIITPYKAQLHILRELFEEKPYYQELKENISINTVDAFQGQERDIILISLVRSNDKGEIGFLKDTRRMNVAMTRARKKMVIVGDSATVGNFPFYSKFLDYIDKVNGHRSAFEFHTF